MPISQLKNIFGIDYIRSRIQAKYNHKKQENSFCLAISTISSEKNVAPKRLLAGIGWDGVVVIGQGSSRSTFVANKLL